MNSLEFTRFLSQMAEKREPFAVATVVRIEGSAIGKPGFKAVVSKEGKILFGTVGGVCPESAIATMTMEAIRTGKARVVKVFLEDARKAVEGTIKSQSVDEVYVETNCGGMQEIYVEPFLPTERLVLIGQGGKDDVEDSLVKLGRMLDFEVVVIDHMPVLSSEPNVLITDLDYDLGRYRFAPTDSVVVLTKGERDIKTLQAIAPHKVRYVGLLASQQRVTDDLQALRQAGVPDSFIQSLHAPIGADIGATAPEEIALSIMAEVVATRHGKQLPAKTAKVLATR